MIPQGYVKDYIFNDDKMVEIWRTSDLQKASVLPRLRGKDGRIIPPDLSLKRR